MVILLALAVLAIDPLGRYRIVIIPVVWFLSTLVLHSCLYNSIYIRVMVAYLGLGRRRLDRAPDS